MGESPGPRGSAERRVESGLRTVGDWIHVGERVILLGVACVLVVTGLLVVLDAVYEALRAVVGEKDAPSIVDIAENALLALILAELVRTLLVSLDGGSVTPRPFLVIAIIGIVRKMLLATVLAPHGADSSALITPLTIELLSLGTLILLLAGALVLLRGHRSGERRSRREAG